MKIKDINERNRPRGRLKEQGVESLSESELLAIIMQIGSAGENVVDMSNRLISKYGLSKLYDCTLEELQEIKGIGFAKQISPSDRNVVYTENAIYKNRFALIEKLQSAQVNLEKSLKI